MTQRFARNVATSLTRSRLFIIIYGKDERIWTEELDKDLVSTELMRNTFDMNMRIWHIHLLALK